MSGIEAYWVAYDATLTRVRTERPDTFAGLKAILDTFEPPSSGQAFFGDGADDQLSDALHDAGWRIDFIEATYLYTARHPNTGARARYVEGDLYDETPERLVRLISTSDPHTRLTPGATGRILHTDDAGTLHIAWGNGSILGLIPGVDRWELVHERWQPQPMVQTYPAASASAPTEETNR
ncbi:DUF4314 domain-containing protein [Microbacterium sp. zg-YB36]|uniref:DUF4314 domain-containing protein n=1 Tax=Microbacterium sp. zg-YB36 TaxID=2969407 RepID=UPI00214BAAC8|nr:DUF4314 domain-containing protein [Microbacterium sp. zg-YB36]MDL5351589.1 DUF4314 domain-containing protein [Microbacterium sp. zg-YB36]